MSDFEEVLAPHKEMDKQKITEKSVNRMNGYNSDYTMYRRGW